MTSHRPQTLIEQLKGCALADFPRGVDYPARYQAISDYITKNVHPHVVVGAAQVDRSVLTGHGREHVDTVLFQARAIADSLKMPLTCLEIYLLAVAAEVHDAGNVSGRTDHQRGAAELIMQGGLLFGDDSSEKRLIAKIAAAHGGKINDNKDTISPLLPKDHIFGFEVRPRLLAAILRFADELADDRTRTSRFLLESGSIAPGSEVHHHYAASLKTPVLQNGSVRLRFELTTANLIQKLGKGETQAFLLDEIFERTRKMDQERLYCMRFLRAETEIDRIDVVIDVYEKETAHDPKFTMSYRLEEAGYPPASVARIECACSGEVTVPNCSTLDGAHLADFLSGEPS